jgi:asparagine synthase (glutamine-hydrolysing)
MPGIAGLITRLPREYAEAKLDRMQKALFHEPFYSTGRVVDEELGLYVCWSARAGSFSDHMPVRNENGSKTLVFSGNDFSDPSVVADLRSRGHQLGESENGYLVHMAEEDRNFPASLNGLFHGVLADKEKQEVLLFNDRFGLQRLYVRQEEDAFYFAGEAKAILEVCEDARAADSRAICEFLGSGYTLGENSFFRGIQIMPQASAWRFRTGKLEEAKQYFLPSEWEGQQELEPESFYRQVRDQFSHLLPRYFKGREKIGFSLTGGLDTRAVLAWRKPEPGTLPCFTFAGSLRESRDVKIARKIAAMCGQPFQALTAGDSFMRSFSHCAERTVLLSDGNAGVQLAPDLYLNELAREIAPVRMTGNYGDQVLRRLISLKLTPPDPGSFNQAYYQQTMATGDAVRKLRSGHALSVAAFGQMPRAFYAMRALEETQLEMRTPFLDLDLLRLLYRSPQQVLSDNRLRVRLIEDGSRELRRIRTDLGFAGIGGPWVEKPFAAFHRFTMRCEWAFDQGMPQWLAGWNSRIAPLHVERLFLGIHKFSHFRIWYQHQLAAYLRTMLLNERTLSRPYVDADGLRRAVEAHLEGKENHTMAFHRILSLEYMHRLFLDGA